MTGIDIGCGKKPGPTLLMLLDAENPPSYFARSFTTDTGQRLFAELLRRYVLREGFEAYVAEQEELGLIRSQSGQSQVPESSAGP